MYKFLPSTIYFNLIQESVKIGIGYAIGFTKGQIEAIKRFHKIMRDLGWVAHFFCFGV